MGPSYKVPKTQNEGARSVWSTTGIFVALGVLTALMALLMYGAIQGMSAGSAPERAQGIRATR